MSEHAPKGLTKGMSCMHHWRATKHAVWGYVPPQSPLFENMGLVFCPNLHRKGEVGVGVG